MKADLIFLHHSEQVSFPVRVAPTIDAIDCIITTVSVIFREKQKLITLQVYSLCQGEYNAILQQIYQIDTKYITVSWILYISQWKYIAYNICTYQSLEIDDILQHKTQYSTVFNAVFSIQRSLQQHTTHPSAYNAVFNRFSAVQVYKAQNTSNI